jgi:hypothetical protein
VRRELATTTRNLRDLAPVAVVSLDDYVSGAA